ncbi:MAG: VOC family protein [Pseudomonadota bacterium]
MKPIPYLTFQGDCAEAMQAYADIFGGTFRIVMRVGDAPPNYTPPPGKDDWVMHAEVTFDDGGVIYGSDDVIGGTPPMAGMSVMMPFATEPAGRAAFDRLAEGGTVSTAWGPTFWSSGFGTLRDRWGKNWMLSTGG